MASSPLPLAGVRVLDLSTLLPGPLCTLLLAEAGAEVIRIERPPAGDEMRSYQPKHGAASANFALLNAGKRSVAVDLKSAAGREHLQALVRDAHVLVEQFRPAVLERLGFGWDTLRRLNPRLVLCSITGYGQEGPAAHRAGHDLNYQAETGLLALAAGADGAPPIPPALIADIAGGAYPAVMNILLALRTAERTGQGCRLDIAMADNLFTLMYWGLAQGFAAGAWPRAGGELVTGGSPRYQIYRTADGRYLAAAPLEDRFWENFLRAIEAPQLLDPALPADQVLQQVRERIAAAPAAYWRERLEALDACCSIVATLQEAVAAPQFARLFQRRVLYGEGRGIAALPVPIDPGLRGTRPERGYPEALEDAA